MVPKLLLYSLYILGHFTAAQVNALDGVASAAEVACDLIKAQFPQLVSFSGMYFLSNLLCSTKDFEGEAQFENDIDHWAASSEQIATCSVEPSNSNEISEIVRLSPANYNRIIINMISR